MLDPLYTKIGNFFHLLGNFGIAVAIIIAVTVAILYTIYKKTDWLTGINGYRFVRTCKKWLLIAIIIAIIGGVLHGLGAYITPNTNDSIEKQIQELD
ncbi:hypothetical protein [Staphylococcus pseudintermedius]|uniref:hypothetical protein n=1 Tax=Staphylococcus pseudintermedius TaxID=283734 RepID=UPI00143F09B7|nr:hypothetical protein [Staphylococcus pseudintermedius]NKM75747.1 hypothetical protein [Staphylococcus pseudintermedius]